MTMGVFNGADASPPWMVMGPIGAMTVPLMMARSTLPVAGTFGKVTAGIEMSVMVPVIGTLTGASMVMNAGILLTVMA